LACAMKQMHRRPVEGTAALCHHRGRRLAR
jgi:hypothetical protein